MNALWIMSAAMIAGPVPDDAVRASVTKGVKRLEAAATNYTKNRSCFSCHHQSLPLMGLLAARERGFAVYGTVIEAQIRFTLDTFTPKLKSVRAGTGIGGANTTVAYALQTLAVAGHKADETTDALVEFLLKNQHKDGYWKPTTVRPPSEGSPFTSTALALQGLKDYGDPIDDDDAETAERLRAAREKAATFLRSGKTENTEDRVFRLWGLVAAGACDKEIGAAAADLLKRQRPDGGWAQLDDLKSDAYATGSAMAVLRIAGTAPTSDAYRRGARFLVRTQHESGGWIVQTRSKPIQKLFDNGDPGGPSQFISTAATGWAVLALAGSFDPK